MLIRSIGGEVFITIDRNSNHKIRVTMQTTYLCCAYTMYPALPPPYCEQSHPSDHVLLLIQASAGSLLPPEHSGIQPRTCHAGPNTAEKVPTVPMNASHSTHPHCLWAFSKHTTSSFITPSLCTGSSSCLEFLSFFHYLDNSYTSFNTQLKSYFPSEVSLTC